MPQRNLQKVSADPSENMRAVSVHVDGKALAHICDVSTTTRAQTRGHLINVLKRCSMMLDGNCGVSEGYSYAECGAE
jgi:hypothetical protein